MNIRLLRICSVPVRISSPEVHVLDTCFFLELHNMERYVTTTYPEFGIIALNVFMNEIIGLIDS